MNKEYSCGAVIFRRTNGFVEFLLLLRRESGNWGFAKGKKAEVESDMETAKREVFEETGLEDFKIIGDFNFLLSLLNLMQMRFEQLSPASVLVRVPAVFQVLFLLLKTAGQFFAE